MYLARGPLFAILVVSRGEYSITLPAYARKVGKMSDLENFPSVAPCFLRSLRACVRDRCIANEYKNSSVRIVAQFPTFPIVF